MEIRPNHESDAAGVIGLWTTVFNYAGAHNDPAASIRRKLQQQRDLFFVALLNGAVAGTVMAGYDGHRGWIYSVAVDPSVRRGGIGSALVRHAESALKALDCPKINLQLLASNTATVAFYRKLGYVVEERVSMGKIL